MKKTLFALLASFACFHLCLAGPISNASETLSSIVIVPPQCTNAHALSVCYMFDQAFAANDADALGRLIADRAMHVNPMGKVMSRETLLKDIQSKDLRFLAYKTKEVDFIQQQGELIVIAGTLEAEAERFEIKVAGQYRFVRVLTTSSTHGWQEMYSQITPIKGAALGHF